MCSALTLYVYRSINILCLYPSYFPFVPPYLAIDLVHRMLAFHPDDRITVEEALDHPYLQDFSGQLPEPTCDVFTFEYEHIELAVGNPAGVTSVEEEKKSKNIRMKLEVQEAIYQEVCRYRPPIHKLPGEDMKCGGGRGEGAEDSPSLHVVTPSFGSAQSLKKPQQEECRDATQTSNCPPQSYTDQSYHTARSASATDPTSSYLPPPPSATSTADAYHPGCDSNTFYTTRTHPHQPAQLPSSGAYNVYGNDDPGKASVSLLSTDGVPLVRGHARVSVDGTEGCGGTEGCSGGGDGCVTGMGAYEEPSIFSFPNNKYEQHAQGSYRNEELKEFYSDPYRDNNIHNSNNSYNTCNSNNSSSSSHNIDRHDFWRPQQQHCRPHEQQQQQQQQQQQWCQHDSLQEQQPQQPQQLGQTMTVDVNFNPNEHSSTDHTINYKKHVSTPPPPPVLSSFLVHFYPYFTNHPSLPLYLFSPPFQPQKRSSPNEFRALLTTRSLNELKQDEGIRAWNSSRSLDDEFYRLAVGADRCNTNSTNTSNNNNNGSYSNTYQQQQL